MFEVLSLILSLKSFRSKIVYKTMWGRFLGEKKKKRKPLHVGIIPITDTTTLIVQLKMIKLTKHSFYHLSLI